MPPASEALYFDNAPVAHIVAFEDRLRMKRIDREMADIASRSRNWDAMANRLAADIRQHRSSIALLMERQHG